MALCSPQRYLLIFSLWLSLLGTSYASGKVTLIATVDNQPALRPALWTIYDLNSGKRLIKSLPRHSGTVDLPAGKYLATLTFDQKIKEKTFRVEADRDTTVIVAMD